MPYLSSAVAAEDQRSKLANRVSLEIGRRDSAASSWPSAAMQSVRYDLAAVTGLYGRIYAPLEATTVWQHCQGGSVRPGDRHLDVRRAHESHAPYTGDGYRSDGRIYVFGGEVAYPPPGVVGLT